MIGYCAMVWAVVNVLFLSVMCIAGLYELNRLFVWLATPQGCTCEVRRTSRTPTRTSTVR